MDNSKYVWDIDQEYKEDIIAACKHSFSDKVEYIDHLPLSRESLIKHKNGDRGAIGVLEAEKMIEVANRDLEFDLNDYEGYIEEVEGRYGQKYRLEEDFRDFLTGSLTAEQMAEQIDKSKRTSKRYKFERLEFPEDVFHKLLDYKREVLDFEMPTGDIHVRGPRFSNGEREVSLIHPDVGYQELSNFNQINRVLKEELEDEEIHRELIKDSSKIEDLDGETYRELVNNPSEIENLIDKERTTFFEREIHDSVLDAFKHLDIAEYDHENSTVNIKKPDEYLNGLKVLLEQETPDNSYYRQEENRDSVDIYLQSRVNPMEDKDELLVKNADEEIAEEIIGYLSDLRENNPQRIGALRENIRDAVEGLRKGEWISPRSVNQDQRAVIGLLQEAVSEPSQELKNNTYGRVVPETEYLDLIRSEVERFNEERISALREKGRKDPTNLFQRMNEDPETVSGATIADTYGWLNAKWRAGLEPDIGEWEDDMLEEEFLEYVHQEGKIPKFEELEQEIPHITDHSQIQTGRQSYSSLLEEVGLKTRKDIIESLDKGEKFYVEDEEDGEEDLKEDTDIDEGFKILF